MVFESSHTGKVKEVVESLIKQNLIESTQSRKVARPWGFYDCLDSGERHQVKRITVHPGAKLSLQMHKYRTEHWVVVKGQAIVTRGDETFTIKENESICIPLGVRHRLANPGNIDLELIEVQSGNYLSEDDIVRIEDEYGRK